ncbi:MAG TPA: peptide-methionine (S)-S-oxide reductase MsrA [Bacteroidia bacterium]|nr:peptide-methionine (S)-S-oxide reductase MsrA [Bacteroidia bacterium]HRH07862.1 peptide-methionine (S)-S-oxide reductase MsrA [Bacteroidia bacterium]
MNNQLNSSELETATFGAGCFWCVEAVFQNLKGVLSVESGFSGGHIKNPAYREVCMGFTGHAEVCQLQFNPQVISYDDLLQIFWQTHDPTQLNRQGNDVGAHYRSVIFYHNEQQKSKAEKYKQLLISSEAFDKPVVTEITAFDKFYKADEYHQNYFNSNTDAPYCQFVIQPKVDKLKKVFQSKLK